MGYVGNLQGPRKSIIFGSLGPEYFGITTEQLEIDIRDNEDEENNKTIDPVYIDKNGRFYLIFNAPRSKTQKYYLDEHGYKLRGKVLVLIDGKETWITL
jgi:hypothetical protein